MSSRYRTLKRGSYFLIHVYSSWSASTSVETTVHWTPAAAVTICLVRGWSRVRSAKYDPTRLRRFLALPT